MGLDNDETPEDSWDTIRLINELEREQPESMFTATALTFVPIGLLEKSDFFNIGSEMTPAQLGVLYKTWQHNFKYGIQKFMTKTGAKGPQRYFFQRHRKTPLGGVPLGAMERYARKKSKEHEHVIEIVKAKYW